MSNTTGKTTCFTSTSFPNAKHSVTLVIPAFNEADNLERLMLFVERTFQSLGFCFPVLLVNDGSTDRTPEILKELQKTYKFLKVVHHPKRQGVAKVWKTALAHVKTEWVLWGQADLETDPRTDIPLLLSACKPGVDAVSNSHFERKSEKIPLLK